MSVNGLERMTERILAEARERREAILADARATCEEISAESTRRAEELRRRLAQEAEDAASAIIAEARSSAAAKRQELLQARRSALTGEVFARVLSEVASMEREKYTELLGGLLAAAIYDFCRTEAENRALYGDEEEGEDAPFEVVLNKKDRDACGAAVLDAARKKLAGKVPEEALASLRLSSQVKKMQGGLILCHGPVECNCSFEMLFAELRRELESEVSRTLFDFKGNGI